MHLVRRDRNQLRAIRSVDAFDSIISCVVVYITCIIIIIIKHSLTAAVTRVIYYI